MSYLVSTPPFSLILLNLEGNRCWTKKGITFWEERLIITLAEELGFKGTQLWLLRAGVGWGSGVEGLEGDS